MLAGFAGYDTPRAVFFDVAIPQVQSLSRFTCLWLWLVFWPDSAEYCGDSTVAVWTRLFLPVVGQRLVLIPDSAGRYSIRGEVRVVSRVTSVSSAARAVRTHVVSLRYLLVQVSQVQVV